MSDDEIQEHFPNLLPPLDPKLLKAMSEPAPDPVNEDAGKPFLSKEDQARLTAIKDSQTWRLIATHLQSTREALFLATPKTTESLWFTWGRITQLSALLQDGPQIVLESGKMESQARSKAFAHVSEAEGTVADVTVHTVKGDW